MRYRLIHVLSLVDTAIFDLCLTMLIFDPEKPITKAKAEILIKYTAAIPCELEIYIYVYIISVDKKFRKTNFSFLFSFNFRMICF